MPVDSATPLVLDTALGNECERIVRRFEEAWHNGSLPDLAPFLPATGLLRRVALVELIHTDIEYRARAGNPAGAAAYLERFPELAGDEVLQVELFSAERRWQESEQESAADRPTSLGKYELLEVVGRGSFGTVHRGRDPELQRTVAVKLFHSDSHKRPEARRRLLREARSAARLRHDHIAAVHDFGEAGGRFYLVSDFIEGQTLQKVLAACRPPLAQTAGWLADVADALHHAHQQGVVHRDVKPSNILLDATGRAVLVDFGLARCDADETALTVEGQVLGTPAYVPPEQAGGGAHRADGRSDVYSLGVLLYESLTGELPFRGTTPMVLHQVLHEEPKPPRHLDDRAPRDLETVCLKAMAKEPHHRYADAGAMADDLRRWLRGEPVRAWPLGRLVRAWRWCRRNPLPAVLAAVLVLVTLAGLAGVGASLARAEREKQRAQEQARRAEERMRQGQELLGAFVRASRSPLLKQQGVLLARKELLDRAAAYFEKLLDPAEANALRDERERLRPGVARERAQAHTVMGQVYQARGLPRAARTSCEEALRLWEELAREVPLSVADRVGQAQARKGLADALRVLDHLAEANTQARAALDLWKKLFEERLGREAEQALAECGVFVADTLADAGPAERAAAWLAWIAHRATLQAVDIR